MPATHTYPDCGWATGVGQRKLRTDDGGEKLITTKVAVFITPEGDQFQFPLEPSDAKDFGEAIAKDMDVEEDNNGSKLVVPGRQPTEEELEAMAHPERVAKEAARTPRIVGDRRTRS